MKRTKFLAILAFVLGLFVLASGCTPKSDAAAGKDGESGLPEGGWLLFVDHTIPVKDGELTTNYTLVLIAEKTGGKDETGVYEGAAYIGNDLDASGLSQDLLNVMGGFNINVFANNLTFEVEPYDKTKYSTYGSEGDASPAPLVNYESMALMSPVMEGGAVIDVDVEAFDGSEGGYESSGGGAAPVVMKVAVKEGKVYVEVPFLNIDKTFEGIVTNKPQKYKKEYQAANEKLKELIEGESDEFAQDDEDYEDEDDEDDFESVSDIMGSFGSGLEVPENFPEEDFPIMPDANIINVYERDDHRVVRVIFGTNKSMDEILEFYKESVIDQPGVEKLDMDDGVMYLGHSEKYQNYHLMVMKDLSTLHEYMVNLEVFYRAEEN